MSDNDCVLKHALITGASRGLGAVLAERFSREGYGLTLVSRDLDALNRVANDLNFTNAKHLDDRDLKRASLAGEFDLNTQSAFSPIECTSIDLSDPVRSEAAILALRQPKFNVVIMNAAIQGPIGPLWENDPDAWEQCIKTNFITPARILSGLIRNDRICEGGSIICISGGGASAGRPYFSAYASAKTALVRLVETLASELKPRRIRCNAIAPGAMKTRMIESIIQSGAHQAGQGEYAAAQNVLSKGDDPMSAAAELALFLSASASEPITGRLISAVWDKWEHWVENHSTIERNGLYTLRRLTARDKNFGWGDR
jgi:NAD(P)-dependent dehydrogenase (short-subunit alcohol dehydrogenase family)